MKTVMSVRISAVLLESARRLATEDGMTLGGWVRRALEREVWLRSKTPARFVSNVVTTATPRGVNVTYRYPPTWGTDNQR